MMSRLKRLATVQCYHCSSNSDRHQQRLSGDNNDEPSSLSPSGRRSPEAAAGEPSVCEVVSVAVRSSGPLGIIIAKHKVYTGFVYVKAFARVEASTPNELESSGKVLVGDLLVAVNRQNLVHLTKDEISDILKTDSDAEEIRVLTFLRAQSGLEGRRCEDLPSIDMSSSSLNDQSSSHSGKPVTNKLLFNLYVILTVRMVQYPLEW